MATIDWRTKGFFVPGPPITDAEFIAAGHDLFDGAFTYPLMFARQAALDANIATLAAFCDRHGLAFAPHLKTHMTADLLAAQLGAGAWGITVATANQALAAHAMGARRIFVANQVLDPVPLRWAAAETGLDFLLTVDSVAGAEVAGAAADGGGPGIRVLVELGHAGGRTGSRTLDELLVVAEKVRAQPGLRLAGVTGYEGGLPGAEAVTGFLDRLREAAAALAGLIPDGDILVSAGGSAWFDLVAARLRGQWLPGRQVTAVLRSGAYVSHDDGYYRERTPFTRVSGQGELRPALGVWAQVLSTPEPGLALIGMGKRDVPFDEGLPEPQRVRHPDGTTHDATGLSVTRVNDHHAYLSTGDTAIEPGDLVLFGISHPCTAFDKWRAIPVVDHDGRVSGVLRPHL